MPFESDRPAGSVLRHVPPGGIGPHDGGGSRSAGASTPSALRTRLRLGLWTFPSSPGPPERVIAATPAGTGRGRSRPGVCGRSRPATGSSLCSWRSLAPAGGGPSTREMCKAWTRGMDGPRHTQLVRRGVGGHDGRMMFPSVAPTVALYSRMTRRGRRPPPLLPLVFAAGYLATWGAAGACSPSPLRRPGVGYGDVLSWDSAGRWVAAATLVLAAVYELTPLKDACLGKSRSPLGFLLGPGVPAAGCTADQFQERRLVRRLLLGADGLALCAWHHERRLDGLRRRADRGGEDPPVASGCDLRDGRGSCSCSACSC